MPLWRSPGNCLCKHTGDHSVTTEGCSHLTSLVWVCVLWLPWKLNGAICAMVLKPEYFLQFKPIPLLIMAWRRKEPCHEQEWNWFRTIYKLFSLFRLAILIVHWGYSINVEGYQFFLHKFSTERMNINYRQTANIMRTLVGNKIVDDSDVSAVSPIGAAATPSSFST